MQPSLSVTEVRYGQAVLSWCQELTDPNGTSEAVAVLLVAETQHQRVAIIVTRGVTGRKNSSLVTRTLLRLVPESLQAILQRTARIAIRPSVDQCLRDVHRAMHGSLWVSDLTSVEEDSLSGSDLNFQLLERAKHTLREATKSSRPSKNETVTVQSFTF